MSSLYLHPLAYLVGLEGVTLMKAYAGDYDRAVTLARLAETKRLLDSADDWGDGVELPLLATPDGYDGWAPQYDNPENGFFAMDEAQLLPLLDRLPAGVAVDVACGTGRYAGHLAARGHEVHGFDTSPGMLMLARAKVPTARFERADMTDLPLPDSSADVVVNTLALTHVADLAPAFAEAARVLRPGGHLLISDVRGYYTGSSRTPLVQTTLSGADRLHRGLEPPHEQLPHRGPPRGVPGPAVLGGRRRRGAADRAAGLPRPDRPDPAAQHLGPAHLGAVRRIRRSRKPPVAHRVGLRARRLIRRSHPARPSTTVRWWLPGVGPPQLPRSQAVVGGRAGDGSPVERRLVRRPPTRLGAGAASPRG